MAKTVLIDAYVKVVAEDLSDHVRSATINYSAEMVDSTTMSLSTRTRLGGLKDWSIDIEFAQDYAASQVDVTLFSLVGTTFAIAVRSTSGAISVTNPEYTGTCILESYVPIQGTVGDLDTATITLQSAGDLTRDTTP